MFEQKCAAVNKIEVTVALRDLRDGELDIRSCDSTFANASPEAVRELGSFIQEQMAAAGRDLSDGSPIRA